MLNFKGEKENIKSNECFHDLMSERLFQINQSLLQYKDRSSSLTLERIAYLVGLKSLDQMLSYYYKESPPFEFFRKYEEIFNIDFNSCFKKETPRFKTLNIFHDIFYTCSDNKILKKHGIEESGFNFIRSTGIKGEVILVIQTDEYKYEILRDPIHLSSHNGGTGYRQLFAFYNWINSSNLSNRPCFNVNEEDFNLLCNGQLHPDFIVKNKLGERWLSEFSWTSLSYSDESILEKNKIHYGSEFNHAQNAILSMLREELAREKSKIPSPLEI